MNPPPSLAYGSRRAPKPGPSRPQSRRRRPTPKPPRCKTAPQQGLCTPTTHTCTPQQPPDPPLRVTLLIQVKEDPGAKRRDEPGGGHPAGRHPRRGPTPAPPDADHPSLGHQHAHSPTPGSDVLESGDASFDRCKRDRDRVTHGREAVLPQAAKDAAVRSRLDHERVNARIAIRRLPRMNRPSREINWTELVTEVAFARLDRYGFTTVVHDTDREASMARVMAGTRHDPAGDGQRRDRGEYNQPGDRQRPDDPGTCLDSHNGIVVRNEIRSVPFRVTFTDAGPRECLRRSLPRLELPPAAGPIIGDDLLEHRR
jgi:hypothetical protein